MEMIKTMNFVCKSELGHVSCPALTRRRAGTGENFYDIDKLYY